MKSADVVGWACGLLLLGLALAYLRWVHPVPALACVLLALACLPPTEVVLARGIDLRLPGVAKVAMVLAALWFSLGVSDLGDLLDQAARG